MYSFLSWFAESSQTGKKNNKDVYVTLPVVHCELQ